MLSLGKTSSSSFEGRVLAMHAVACFGRGHEAEFAEATKARAAVCVVGGVVVVGDGCLVCVWCAVWSVRFGNEEARIIEIMMEKVAALEKVDRSCFFFPDQNVRRRIARTQDNAHTLTQSTRTSTFQEVNMLLRTAIAGSRKAVGAGIVQSGSSNKALQVSRGKGERGAGSAHACVLGRRNRSLRVRA